MKSKIGIIFDTLAVCFVLFIIEYFWLSKVLKNAFLCCFFLNLLNILTFFVIFKFSVKKYKLEKISMEDQKFAKTCFETLRFLNKEEYNNFFKQLLNCTEFTGNIFENDTAFFYVNLKKCCDEEDFFSAYNFKLSTDSSKPLCFICLNASSEFLNLISSSPINFDVFNETDLFLIMKEKNLFPTIRETPKSRVQKLSSLKAKFTGSITHSHFKEFFFSGVSLVVISVVIPFSTYYLIFGTFLLVLSIISLFIKNRTLTVKSKATLSELVKDATLK